MKKAAIAFLLLFALGGAAVFLAFNHVDVLVKWTLEHYGPDVTGVAVKVGDVDMSPKNGQGSIKGLELGSPPGFTAPRTVHFGEIRVSLDPATVTQSLIHVHELVIDAPQVTYEKGAKSTNLDAIQQRIEAYVKKGEAEGRAKPGGRAEKRRFIIDRLVIRRGRVTMTNNALRGQGLGFDLPEVELRDVGARQKGLTASEIAAVVASALQQRIAQKVLTNIDLLRKGGVEGAIDALRGLVK